MPSVLTVLHCELLVEFMSKFVIVMFWLYATNVSISASVSFALFFSPSGH